MSSTLRIAAVSYLNTKPLIYGFNNPLIAQDIELSVGYPAKIAQDLIHDRVDIGLVPVATIPEIPNAHIISKYCIGAVGKVMSVCIFSKVPKEAIKVIYLDYQSRTSVKLAQVLVREYWKREDIVFQPAPENFIDLISGDTAAVIIGDRALEQLSNFEHIFDLSEEWQVYTGLPFVFAAWMSNKVIDKSFIEKFEMANQIGFDNMDQVIKDNEVKYYDIKTYYTKDIQYNLDEEKLKGLQLFISKISPDTQINIL